LFIEILDDLTSLIKRHGIPDPVVDDEKVPLGQLCGKLRILAIHGRSGQFPNEIRGPVVDGQLALAASLSSQGAGEIVFSDACRSHDDQVDATGDPEADGKY